MRTFFIYFIGFLFLPAFSHAQLIAISGFVKNQLTDEGIISATVYETESGIGTITNSDGYYRLRLTPGERHIEFSNPGYKPVSFSLNLVADTTLSVTMVSLSASAEAGTGTNTLPDTTGAPKAKASRKNNK